MDNRWIDISILMILSIVLMLTLAEIVILYYRYVDTVYKLLPDPKDIVPVSIARVLLYGHKQLCNMDNIEYIKDGLERERRQMYEETLPSPAKHDYQRNRWPWKND